MQTEDEQLNQLKNWWNSNGKSILVGVLLALALTAGWRYWQQHQINQKEQAALIFNSVLQKIDASDKGAIVEQLSSINKEYASLGYAQYSSLLLAKIAVDNEQFEEAIELLRVLLNKNYDADFNELVKVRLARLLIETKKYDDALQLLDSDSKNMLYKAVKADLKGDIFLAQNNLADARSEYLKAHDLAINEPDLATLVVMLELKLDDLAVDES